MSRYTAHNKQGGKLYKMHLSGKAGRTDGWKIDGYEVNIACSNWVMFHPREKDLIMKMFEVTLDDYIKKAKKSHRIMLKCLWKNIGCYKKGERYQMLSKKTTREFGRMVGGTNPIYQMLKRRRKEGGKRDNHSKR